MTKQEAAYKLGFATGKLAKAMDRNFSFDEQNAILKEVFELLKDCANYFYQGEANEK